MSYAQELEDKDRSDKVENTDEKEAKQTHGTATPGISVGQGWESGCPTVGVRKQAHPILS